VPNAQAAKNHVPEWADKQLSSELPKLRARGESQDMEFMESFPENMRGLGKEIAAFATSNQGLILIGVSDAGELMGLPGAETSAQRDQLVRRIEGSCRGTVRPAITPAVRFGVEDGKTVMAITVPRGNQPVYYSNNVPYVRHITESRPAEPHEVLDLIRAWLLTAPAREEAGPFSELLSRLASTLFEVLIYGEEAEERDVNPWLDQWRSRYHYAADELRDIASNDLAVERQLAPEVIELSRALDEVAGARLYAGGGPDLMALLKKAVDLARSTKERWIDPAPLSADSIKAVREGLRSTARRLRELASRAEPMIEEQDRLDEFQAEAASVGKTLLRIGHYKIDQISADLGDQLRTIGRRLHLVETMEVYADGGLSLRAIVNTVSQCADELEKLLASIEGGSGS
jgi:ATP-dependent DNA helicase RecG